MKIDYDRLAASSAENARAFAAAVPHRHAVLDSFLRPGQAEIGRNVFAEMGARGAAYRGFAETRTLEYDVAKFPAFFRELTKELASPRFHRLLETLTASGPFSDDPRHVEFGLIQTSDGGHHGVHVDPNMHARYDVYRRITMLIYFTRAWSPAYGGDLQLYDARLRGVEAAVAPQFNRCALMECRDDAYHGVKPLTVPPEVRRCALIATFFAADPGPGQGRRRRDVRFYRRPGSSLAETASYVRFRSRTLLPQPVRAFIGEHGRRVVPRGGATS